MVNFIHRKLDNGLEIAVELNEHAYSLAVGFFVRAGARDETAALAGVSHFLEHMLFKGTDRRSADQVNRELDDMGGYANAFTSDEMTCYYAVVLPELQEHIVDLLGDIMRPALRQSDFDIEKKVIIEEINMYADQPPFGIDDQCRQLFFGEHPLGHSVLGTAESVGNLTSGQMREYFLQRYSSNNIVVVATGRVDVDALVRQLEKITKEWKPSDNVRVPVQVVSSRGKHIKVRESATQEYVFQLCDAPGIFSSARYSAAMLACIIGDDVGSRMFWALLDSGKADVAGMFYADCFDAGFFASVLHCDPERVSENLGLMQSILDQVQANGVEEDELSRAKNKLISRCVLGGENSRGRLFPIGDKWLQCRKYYSVQDDVDGLKQVTCADIRLVLDATPVDKTLLVAIGPLADF
ncbi:MAG: pitrilysin family protein [Planctomycetia bacterium]|nr:pitrilysin family protein [Planctomycetia bacterium]